MPACTCIKSQKQQSVFARILITFSILLIFSTMPVSGICITPNNDSSLFRYPESGKILRDFKAHPHKLTKPQRKILRKELKYQSRQVNKGDKGNIGLQIFLLVLLTLAILWGTFLVILVLAAYVEPPLFLLILLGLFGIASIILLLIGGSKRIKKRKKINAETGKTDTLPAAF